mgnify:FL=1
MNCSVPLTRGDRPRASLVVCEASLYWARSFHGVSVDLVADTAKINKATVYRYFKDKRDLALAVERYNGILTRDMIFATSFAEYPEPQDRLAAIFRYAYRTHHQKFAENGDVFGCPIVGLSLELGQEMPEIREEAARLFDELEGFFTENARQAAEGAGSRVNPSLTGRTLAQLMHGANASSSLAADASQVLDAGRAAMTLIGFPDTPILLEEPA